MSASKYDYLKELYPEFISKEQLYKICKISKESAKWLLDNNVIPNKSNGKQTRRYKIALLDVINYLIQRDITGKTSVPKGVKNFVKKHTLLEEQQIPDEVKNEIRIFFKDKLRTMPDLLTISDLITITGLSKSWLNKCMAEGILKSFKNKGRNIVPKEYVLEFVSSKRYIDLAQTPSAYKYIINEFYQWKKESAKI